MHFEIVPMKSVDAAIAALPPQANVSVTCSPTAGIPETRRLTELLVGTGHHVTPHVAARLVTGPGEAAGLAAWTRSIGIDEVFVIAGDAPTPAGPYDGALGFLRDFVAAGPGVTRIGITGYPDGHALIDSATLTEQLHAKQRLLDDAGLSGWVSTQMCFDAEAIRSWLEQERRAGLHLPIRLGVPGVVDRARLLRMGTRLGIGTSLRFLSKNTATIGRLVAPGGYDPSRLVGALAPDAARLGIDALHSFTFNAVDATFDWQQRLLADADHAVG
jgi:methylenetetrahydrofolate reductase (NADPH)